MEIFVLFKCCVYKSFGIWFGIGDWSEDNVVGDFGEDSFFLDNKVVVLDRDVWSDCYCFRIKLF